MRIKALVIIMLILAGVATFAQPAHAASGIFASGGGTYITGQTFTVTVTASGSQFDSLEGKISVSGPVSITSFSGGDGITWVPGYSPADGKTFDGLTSPTTSVTVARVTLRATGTGSGSVSVSGAKLARNGQYVGTASGGASFTINRAPVYPSAPTVTSPSHPDQNQAYTATTIQLQWNKDRGVTGFSYFLDQSPNTTPNANADSANTSVTYDNKAVGTYYFHIRAENGDGWSSTTTFKITIKEPDPKVSDTLAKPTITTLQKDATWTVDLANGTASGIVLAGTAPANYQANITFDPTVTPPSGKTLSPTADAQGKWRLLIDWPIKAGVYKVTVQGQQNKTLTPPSDPATFEIILAQGGAIRFLTARDTVKPTPVAMVTSASSKAQWLPHFSLNKRSLLSLLAIIPLGAGGTYVVRRQRKRRREK